MLTIQILDGGETFFRPLDRNSLTLGSSPEADLQLLESEVAPLHARILPVAGGHKIVDLDSPSGTLVNGEPVIQWRLNLGDRIEIGRAVLVVGQRVERPATASDVLDSGLTRTSNTPRTARRATRSNRGVAIGGVVAGLLLCGAFALWGGGGEAPPEYWPQVMRRASAADFDEAERLLASLRRDWGDAAPERRARVDELANQVAALRRAIAEGRERVREEAQRKTRGKQVEELRAATRADPDGADGSAARILLAELDELRLGIVTMVDPTADPDHGDPDHGDPHVGDGHAGAGRSGDGHAGEGDPSRRPDAADAVTSGSTIDARLLEIRRVCEEGVRNRALHLIEAELVATDDELVAGRLRSLRSQIYAELEDQVAVLLTRARVVAGTGRPRDLQRAVAMLADEVDGFPVSGGGAEVAAELRRLRGALATAENAAASDDVAGAAPTGAIDLAEFEDAARQAEARGDYVTAATLLQAIVDRATHAVADAASERDAERRLLEARLLAALEGHLASRAAAAGGLVLLLRDRHPVQLCAENGRLLQADGAAPPWSEFEPEPLFVCLDESKAPAEALLGAAILSYRAGARAPAERRLLSLVGQQGAPAELTSVIARGRGDILVDARGYRAVGGAIVAIREVENRKAAADVERRLAAALRGEPKARAAELEKILAGGPGALDSTIFALRSQLSAIVDRVEGHAFRKTWERVGELRRDLDQRRDHALDLIFDEKQYFYPYRPPAVSGKRAAEYSRVQAEVDERVRSVQEAWKAKTPPRKVPVELARDVERIDWLVTVLADFGETAEAALDKITWVRTLPPDGKLGLRSFCWTPAEREQATLNERIHAHNARQMESLSKAEASQIKITNDYREMLGRAPLPVCVRLIASSRGHAEEMARLGYFSHFSPVAGRRTPFERMRLAGYQLGISENLANHPSAASAHHGWTHSSGHHRNLLMESHGEFGVGNNGKYWVQNFGTGAEFREDSRF